MRGKVKRVVGMVLLSSESVVGFHRGFLLATSSSSPVLVIFEGLLQGEHIQWASLLLWRIGRRRRLFTTGAFIQLRLLRHGRHA